MTILLVSTDFTWFRPCLLGLGRLGQDSQDMAKTLRIQLGSLVSGSQVGLGQGVHVSVSPILVLRAVGDKKLGYQTNSHRKYKISKLLRPLFIGPMGLGFRNDASISTVGSKRSSDPQHFLPEKPLINDSHITPPRVASRRLGSRHTSGNGTAARPRETDRHLPLKTHRTYLPSSLGGKCTSMGETDTWTPDRGRLGCPRPVCLTETREPGRILRVLAMSCESWLRRPKPKRPGRNQVKSA